MFKSSLIVAALLAIPEPALAQIVFVDPPPPIAPPTRADMMKSDTDKIECRAENTLGSRLGRHQVCLTKEQWWAFEQEARQRVQDWGRLGSTSH